jgi:hypothetical protein
VALVGGPIDGTKDPSPHNGFRFPALRRRFCASFAWLAIVALLGNVLLPASVSIGAVWLASGSDAPSPALCGSASGRGLPGKPKPALLLHHCALCALAPAALLPPHPTGSVLEWATSGKAQPSLRDTTRPPPFGHCWAQPRAPPVAA